MAKYNDTGEILQTCVLTPAYGRDYKSLKAVEDDFNAGKDFRINHFYARSTYCSVRDFIAARVFDRIAVRYAKLTKTGFIRVRSNIKLEK